MLITSKRLLITAFSLLLASCGGSDSNKNSAMDRDFELIVSYSTPTRFNILFKEDFSGALSYIISKSELSIISEDSFTANTAVKRDVTVVADNLTFNNYIQTDSLSSGTKYYIYLLNKENGEVICFVESTGQNHGSEVVTGTSGSMTYNINLPYGYDPVSSRTWPLLVSLKGPNQTFLNNNFPCITFNANINGGGTYSSDLASLKTTIASIVNTYKIDKSRIYGIGYSAGGCAIIEIANNDDSADYQFKALAVNGISAYLVPSRCSNLGEINTMLFYGELDTTTNPGTINVHNKIVSLNGTGEHIVIEMPGLDHNTCYNPPWTSPYTFMWLLDK